MKSIDIKSQLIGILGTALVVVLMGVTHSKGSYQIACEHSRCFILETNSGMSKRLSTRIVGQQPNIYLGTPWDWEGN
tara:strand:- start:142 stop:372 length:231 start_codon:yes stop_codon:yes gene_type:complete